MKKMLLILCLFLSTSAYASDYHQSDSPHKLTYVLLSTDGTAVSGQNIGVAVERAKDGAYLDFNDNTFKQSAWTKRTIALTYNSTDSFYYRVLSIDNGGILSGEYCAIVTNDSTTYRDRQVECVEFDNLSKLIRTNR